MKPAAQVACGNSAPRCSTYRDLPSGSWFILPNDPEKTEWFKTGGGDAINREYKSVGFPNPDQEVIPL